MTQSTDKRFRYTLEPLLKKRQFDWTSVKAEETNAKAVVDRHESEVKQVQGIIGEAETLVRQSSEFGASIDPARQQGLANYLSIQQGELQEKRKQLERANKVHEQINRNLNTIRQGIKALEKHQERKKMEFTTERARREYSQLDELWLIGNKGAQAARTFGISKPDSQTTKTKNGGNKNGS